MLDTFKKATPEALDAIREEMRVRGTSEVFLLFGMGSQFDHLIFQKIAKQGVYGLFADPASVTVDDVAALGPIGIFTSGGPASVHAEPPPFDARIFSLGIPVLGTCLGFQTWAKAVGARVKKGTSQFSTHPFTKRGDSLLFVGCPETMPVLQSHGDEVEGDGIKVLGTSGGVVAAGQHRHLWGVQFHPECSETTHGDKIFENFIFGICKAKDRFPVEDVAEKKVAELVRLREAGVRILLMLSGGSDSASVAYLCKAAGFDHTNLRGVYVKGVDRADDETHVREHFDNQPWIDLKFVDATDRLLEALAGKTKMREKRTAGFIPIYNQIGGEEAEEWSEGGRYEVYVGQGTLYTDLSESGAGHTSGARKAVIKSHHNVKNEFRSPRTKILFAEVTPLADQVKDTGRSIGRMIGVPEELLIRHPFPGPGRSLRIDGEVTREKLALEGKADAIFIEELRKASLYKKVWQAGAVLLMPGSTEAPEADRIAREVVGSMSAVALRAEHTFTKGDDAGSGPIILVEAASLDWGVLELLQQRISNEVAGIGAVAVHISAEADYPKRPLLMLWAVHSVNGFTARHAELPVDFLEAVQKRISAEIPEIGSVIYRISNKPISTIEIG